MHDDGEYRFNFSAEVLDKTRERFRWQDGMFIEAVCISDSPVTWQLVKTEHIASNQVTGSTPTEAYRNAIESYSRIESDSDAMKLICDNYPYYPADKIEPWVRPALEQLRLWDKCERYHRERMEFTLTSEWMNMAALRIMRDHPEYQTVDDSVVNSVIVTLP
jgi:hypothetical protein